MALTPEDIERHTFKVARRGYDKVEVDRFLIEVATSYRELQQQATAVPTPSGVDLFGTDAPKGAGGGELFAAAEAPATVSSSGPAPASDPAPALAPASTSAPEVDGDDFNRLGSEVANVLRSAHASVATLRHEAEVEAAMIRQRAEQECADLRREADEYAARVRAEADAYATDRATEANVSRREADRVMAEARAKADLHLADTERRIAAITEQAEVNAQARSQEILADANRRLEAAKGTEAALRERLIAAHGDLNAALALFTGDEERAPAEPATPPGPVLDLTDAPGGESVLDLTDGAAAEVAAEPSDTVPPGWPGAPPVAAGSTDLFGDAQGAVATADPVLATDPSTAIPETPAPAPAGDAEDEAQEDVDPLPAVVRDAIGRAVQSALNRTEGDA